MRCRRCLPRRKRLAKPAILTLPQFDATSGELIDRGCLLDPFFNPVPNLDPKRSDVAMVIGACLWIPKDLWDEMEGFPGMVWVHCRGYVFVLPGTAGGLCGAGAGRLATGIGLG